MNTATEELVADSLVRRRDYEKQELDVSTNRVKKLLTVDEKVNINITSRTFVKSVGENTRTFVKSVGENKGSSD
jgi:hypothetical protein